MSLGKEETPEMLSQALAGLCLGLQLQMPMCQRSNMHSVPA